MQIETERAIGQTGTEQMGTESKVNLRLYGKSTGQKVVLNLWVSSYFHVAALDTVIWSHRDEVFSVK